MAATKNMVTLKIASPTVFLLFGDGSGIAIFLRIRLRFRGQ
jgi:hypothetical protein